MLGLASAISNFLSTLTTFIAPLGVPRPPTGDMAYASTPSDHQHLQQQHQASSRATGEFLLPIYSNENILLIEERRLARRRSPGLEYRTVYVDQPLTPPPPAAATMSRTSDGEHQMSAITFRVTDVSSQASASSLVIGVTTCDSFTVRNNECHALSPCGPETSCHGRSLTFFVHHCDRVGDLIRVERSAKDRGQVRIYQITGSLASYPQRSYVIRDDAGVFRNRNAYPFIMLTGSVDAVRIVANDAADAVAAGAAAGTAVNVSTGAAAGASGGRGQRGQRLPPAFRSDAMGMGSGEGYPLQQQLERQLSLGPHETGSSRGQSSMSMGSSSSSGRSTPFGGSYGGSNSERSGKTVGRPWQCIRCRIRPSNHMCNPCHHAVYCSNCFRIEVACVGSSGAVGGQVARCPKCDKYVNGFIQILFEN